jgi:hypothetical protein
VIELIAALTELRVEERLALSVAAWDRRIEDAAGQSLFVETEAMKEPRTDPREVAATAASLPVAVVRAYISDLIKSSSETMEETPASWARTLVVRRAMRVVASWKRMVRVCRGRDLSVDVVGAE